MSKVLNLIGEERLNVGKGPARALKVNKKIPAIIYGGKKKSVMISLPEKELSLEFHKSGFMSHLFDLEIGNTKYRVIPKHIQLDPVTDKVIHADFIHVDEHAKIKVSIPIEFTNREKSIGIKQGGVLNAVKHEIEVLCKPDLIPASITIDLSELGIGSSVHLKDIKLPSEVEATGDADLTIATIIGSTKEVVVEAEAAEAAPATADKKAAAGGDKKAPAAGGDKKAGSK
jgi:large subunit ribosomal protein L25